LRDSRWRPRDRRDAYSTRRGEMEMKAVGESEGIQHDKTTNVYTNAYASDSQDDHRHG